MKELVEVIVRALVDHPEDVQVLSSMKGEEEVLTVKVAPDDMGRIIGRQGRIARSIRTVVKAAAIKDNVQVSVDIE